MAAATAPSAHPLTPEALHALASSLATFLRPKVPRLTFEIALEVVRELESRSTLGPKLLAKYLRGALDRFGVKIKHTAALEAASRLLGHASWHSLNRNGPPSTLKLITLTEGPEELFPGWHTLTPRLCAWCIAWQEAKGVRVFTMQWGADFAVVNAAVPKESTEGETDQFPILSIRSVGDSKNWLHEAPTAFETLRRHLEATSRAVLDGVAVLQLCARDLMRGAPVPTPSMPLSVTPSDACNSELILLAKTMSFSPERGSRLRVVMN